MRVAILMDPIDKLHQKKDTTLALIESALILNYDVYVFYPSTWFWKQGKLYAQLFKAELNSDLVAAENFASVQALEQFDLILMRQDPPVNYHYLYTSYALDTLVHQGIIVSNLPSSVRDWNEKFAISNFPSLIVPTLISQQVSELKRFREEHATIVLKPLHAFGGESVFLILPEDPNFLVVVENMTKNGHIPIMAQRYIPEIKSKGDKRILMIHGQAVPYALARMPADTDWRGNLAVGARGEVVPLSDQDKIIAQTIGPILIKKGLHFVGLDVIGDFLTEINVTSPTGLREITAAIKLDIAQQYWQGF